MRTSAPIKGEAGGGGQRGARLTSVEGLAPQGRSPGLLLVHPSVQSARLLAPGLPSVNGGLEWRRSLLRRREYVFLAGPASPATVCVRNRQLILVAGSCDHCLVAVGLARAP